MMCQNSKSVKKIKKKSSCLLKFVKIWEFLKIVKIRKMRTLEHAQWARAVATALGVCLVQAFALRR